MNQRTFDESVENRQLGEITPRSVLLGIVACSLVSIWLPMSEYLIGASRLNLSQLPVGAFGFFFAVVIVNSLVGRFSQRLVLKPAEVLVIFVMVFLATVMAGADMLEGVFGVMAPPYYLATPENRWIDDLWPYLKQWAVVRGPSEELRWAFVGMPSDKSIPWHIWPLPTFWWATFIGAVGFASICLASLLRKQWADYERLAFPLAQAPLEIMSNPGGRYNLPAILRRRAFWVGAAIPLFIIIWNIIGYFEPLFPHLPVMDQKNINFGQGFPVTLTIKLNMYVVGFAYMVNANVLLSVWVWHLLTLIEQGTYLRVGYTLGGPGDPYGSTDALTSWQEFGGLIVFVLWGLWMARHYLRNVWLVITAGRPADDERELLPYRWSILGLLASVLYVAGFLIALGMSWKMVLVFLFGAFVAYLGTTRMIAQTGLVYMRSPLTPTMFTFHAFGSLGVPASELVGIVGVYTLVVNGRAPLMPAIFHISWLGAKIGRSGRRMFVVAAIGLTVAFLVGAAYMIYISYMHGTSTSLSVGYERRGAEVYGAIVTKMQEKVPVDTRLWMWLGIGALMMSILTFVQYRVPGWPLHPIGFPIAATHHVNVGFFSIFLVWLIKSILMRLGGIQAYERAKPVFLGIIAGYALGVTLSFLVDWIWFPGAGHQIHNW